MCATYEERKRSRTKKEKDRAEAFFFFCTSIFFGHLFVVSLSLSSLFSSLYHSFALISLSGQAGLSIFVAGGSIHLLQKLLRRIFFGVSVGRNRRDFGGAGVVGFEED